MRSTPLLLATALALALVLPVAATTLPVPASGVIGVEEA